MVEIFWPSANFGKFALNPTVRKIFISLDELIKVQEFNFQILINFSSSSSYLKLTNYLNRNVKIIDLWGNWEAYEAQFINYFKFSKN